MKTYTNIGAQPIEIARRVWLQPGETGQADLSPEKEAFFVKIGAFAIPDVAALEAVAVDEAVRSGRVRATNETLKNKE